MKGRLKPYPYITGVSVGIPIQDSLAGGKYLLDIVSISGVCDVLPSSKVGGDEVTPEEAMTAIYPVTIPGGEKNRPRSRRARTTGLL